MRQAYVGIVLAVVVLVAGGTSVRAQDADFLMMAGSGGELEIKSSQLALQKGTADAVKKFAQHMIDDHTKASQELVDVATKKGFRVTPGLVRKHLDVYANLAREVQGFDALYARAQVESHEEAVALFEKQAKEGKDADLKGFAEKTLPTLRKHLDMARDMAKSVGAGKDKDPKDPKKEEPKKDDKDR